MNQRLAAHIILFSSLLFEWGGVWIKATLDPPSSGAASYDIYSGPLGLLVLFTTLVWSSVVLWLAGNTWRANAGGQRLLALIGLIAGVLISARYLALFFEPGYSNTAASWGALLALIAFLIAQTWLFLLEQSPKVRSNYK